MAIHFYVESVELYLSFPFTFMAWTATNLPFYLYVVMPKTAEFLLQCSSRSMRCKLIQKLREECMRLELGSKVFFPPKVMLDKMKKIDGICSMNGGNK